MNNTAVSGGSGFNEHISSSVTDDYDDYEDYSSVNIGFQLPPPEIVALVDGPQFPTRSSLKRRSSAPLAELARTEEEKLAGIRIDAECNSGNQISIYTGIEVHQILNDSTTGPGNVTKGVETTCGGTIAAAMGSGNKKMEEIAIVKMPNGNEEPTRRGVLSDDDWARLMEDLVAESYHDDDYRSGGYGSDYGFGGYGSGYESG